MSTSHTGIQICVMTLAGFVLFAWVTIAAPCPEIGVFLSAVAVALAVALIAWWNSERITGHGMRVVYYILFASITLAVASLIDLADFSLLGERRDGEAGLLLGGFSAFMIVLTIATRLRRSFPGPLQWAYLAAMAYAVVFCAVCELGDYGLPGILLLFVMAICWFLSCGTAGRSGIFPRTLAFCVWTAIISVTTLWFTLASGMLLVNIGPARIIALLHDTPLWPGDKVFVRLAMKEESLWPELVADHPIGSNDVFAYLSEIAPSIDRFSGIISTDDGNNDDAGLDDADLGLLWTMARNQLALKKVSSRSPAGIAGLERGDRIITINGKGLDTIKDEPEVYKLFGKWKPGNVVSLKVTSRAGKNREVAITVGESEQDPPLGKVFTNSHGEKIGYLYLDGFNNAQFQEIDKYFKEFKRNRVRDLVLDLRYNNGGRIDNTTLLADLIAGQRFAGEVFVKLKNSARYSDRDEEYLFQHQPESLATRRVVVITSSDTCSASEAIINGLKPYLPVTTVGSRTCGKPFAMTEIEFGTLTLMPVTSRVFNSRDESDYENGIAPDIEAADDLTHELGDPEEEMLKKALAVLNNQHNNL